MIITKDKVALRPFKLEDFRITSKWRHDIELRKLMQLHSFPVTEELEQEWIDSILKSKSDKIIHYAIENIDGSKLIGYLVLKNIDWISRTTSLGIIIGDQGERSKGFGTTSLELGLKFAFDYLNLRKIYLEVLSENKPANTLYEKAGFIEEGMLKRQFFFDGQYNDIRIMSIFNNQYNS